MHISENQQEILADDLATLLHEEELLVAFARRSNQLYNDYDEYTADKIMKRMKDRFLEKMFYGK